MTEWVREGKRQGGVFEGVYELMDNRVNGE
jgi:hypothetical protein